MSYLQLSKIRIYINYKQNNHIHGCVGAKKCAKSCIRQKGIWGEHGALMIARRREHINTIMECPLLPTLEHNC